MNGFCRKNFNIKSFLLKHIKRVKLLFSHVNFKNIYNFLVYFYDFLKNDFNNNKKKKKIETNSNQ